MSTRTRRLLRESALTTAAALGVLCVVTALAAPLLGMKLLVFKSGSMSPEIKTGGLALTRTVSASDLAPGDVVSVTTSEGTRVTHRITKVTPSGDQVLLQLKGDANAKADKETYPVTDADRVITHVNGLGYVVDALASPYAVFLAGGAAAGLLVLTFRRHTTDTGSASADAEPVAIELNESTEPTEPDARGGRRRAVIAAGLVAGALAAGTATYAAVSGGTVAGTLAAFSDTAAVNAPASSMTVPAPAGAVGCTNGTAGQGLVNVNWTAVANPPAGFQYRVDVYKTDPATPAHTYTTTDANVDVKRSDGLDGFSTYHVRVSGEIDGSTWTSAGHIERNIGTGLMPYDIAC